MRKFFIITLSLAVATVVPGQIKVGRTAKGQSSESQTNALPRGWSRTGAHRENYFLAVDTKERHGGRASATIISKNAASDEGFGSMKQDLDSTWKCNFDNGV